MEAQFTLVGVTTDAIKFNHALFSLDEESVALVADMLSECSYSWLKNHLIRRL